MNEKEIKAGERTAEPVTPRRFLEIANRHSKITPMLQEFVKETKNLTNCAAVGIRLLDESGNIPYTAYLGFSREFYEKESLLSIKTDNCMCINVIRGTTDPGLSFYTEYGSFYINGTTRFLARVSEEEKGKTRNVCNAVGYESVALIPIRSGSRIFGLIHLADYREDMVPLEMVRQLEQATPALGISIQRVLAEKKLRLSEEKYRELANSISDPFFALNKDLRFTYWNRASETNTGIPEDSIIGEYLFDVFPELKGTPLERAYNEAIAAGKVQFLENRWDQQGGAVTYHDVSVYPTADGISVFSKDVTRRKQMEEALRKAHDELELRVQERTAELKKTMEALGAERQRFNDILDMLPAYLVLLSPDYHVPFANRFFRERFGESRGFRCFEYLFKRSEPCEICETYSVLKTKAPHHWEWTGPDGRNYDIYDFPFTDVEGSTLILEVGIDITERKRAEIALMEGEASYRELTESINDLFFAMDKDLRYTYWNKASEALTGIQAKDAIGKSLYKLFPDVRGTKVEKLFIKVLKTQRPEHFESPFELGGKKFIFEVNVYPTSVGLSVIAKNITEKKMLEAQLLRAQRMESIGTLAGGMAHDLNNLLTPMMLSLQMLKQRFQDEQSQKLLTILEQNSRRGADLIKQVLSFTRGVEGERKALQAKYLISEIEKIAKETFPRNIEIGTDVKEDLSTISGDATQLHQVIMNLCVNARDAMPDGGTLSISAENFFIDDNYMQTHVEARTGPYVVISVSDTGTGIHPRILDRIFDPFFTTKEFGKGTGLGLSTVLAIVKSHGGFIDVQSDVGKGTLFRVYLPAASKTEKQEAQPLPAKPVRGHGETILVVDDEAPIRETTCTILEKYGYRAIAACDGVEAISQYTKNRNDIKLVLIDMSMPFMDGPTCIHALQRIDPDIKIIAVSGLMEEETFSKVENSVIAILRKPYTAESLLENIHKAWP